VIFYRGDKQKLAAEASKAELGKSGAYQSPIVTEISRPARSTRRGLSPGYYRNNREAGYCKFIIRPKWRARLKK